jgi:2-polyprenyl-3-methyl-5-hydroxy-6-metoxy-1,4-benzoquinol methylase
MDTTPMRHMKRHMSDIGPIDTEQGLEAAARYLPEVLHLKYGDRSRWGWGPSMRTKFGYCTPEDWYEATVFSLVTETTNWLDVGCGRELLPSNRPAAEILARRCRLLAGVDPSENVLDNQLLHRRTQISVEEYRTDEKFDLITLAMVAEHIIEPQKTLAALARLAAPGGRVVIYTVDKWSTSSVVATLTPTSVHHLIKTVLWRTEERDTFPTAYRMNTRRELARLFAQAGFPEETFCRLADTRAFGRWKTLAKTELVLWRILLRAGLPYPERCILAVYRNAGGF